MPSPAPSPLDSDRDDPQTSRLRRIDHGLRTIVIGGNHRSAIRGDEIAEQPQLGGKIMRDVGMIIHVIARQIGEAAGADPDAVQPILIEPMRRRLERQMGDAVARDFIELAMQRYRIRRRQRSVDGAPGDTRPMVPMLAEA